MRDARRRRRSAAVLGGVRRSGGQARGRAARRSGLGMRAVDAPALRPEGLPGRALRSARSGPQPAERRRPRRGPLREHDRAPARRPRAAARAPRHRALARARHVVGEHTRARLRAAAPRARVGGRAHGRDEHPPVRCRVDHPRRGPVLPARVGGLPRRRARRRARRRPRGGVRPAARLARRRGPRAGRARLVRLGGRARLARSGRRCRRPLRRRRTSASPSPVSSRTTSRTRRFLEEDQLLRDAPGSPGSPPC